jgi:hypothetical protein
MVAVSFNLVVAEPGIEHRARSCRSLELSPSNIPAKVTDLENHVLEMLGKRPPAILRFWDCCTATKLDGLILCRLAPDSRPFQNIGNKCDLRSQKNCAGLASCACCPVSVVFADGYMCVVCLQDALLQ